MKKRILALVLSVAMVLSFVPFSVFASTNQYASGLEDTASYLLKVPTESDSYTIVEEDGEKFIKLEDLTSKEHYNTSVKATLADGTNMVGIPEEIALESDVTTMWIAMRVKINDNSPAYSPLNSSVRLYASSSTSSNANQINGRYNYAFRWLDLKDGSMTWAYPWSGSYINSTASAEFEFTGDMDGYLMIPIAKNSSITADFLRNEFSGFGFRFYNTASATAGKKIKESSWENKEFLVGDCFILSDPAAFQTARTTGINKYAPNGLSDTAYYSLAIRGYRTSFYNAFADFVGKDWYSTTTAAVDSSNHRNKAHVTTLSNGDLAYEFTVNEGADYSAQAVDIPAADTYENYKGNYTDIGDIRCQDGYGVPEEIDLTNLRTLAFRVATKDGTVENEAFTFSYNVGVYGGTKDATKYKLGANVEVDYVDIKTEQVTTLTTDENGNISYTGNLDGYLLIAIDDFSTELTADAIKTGWNAHNNTTYSANELLMVDGFANGKAFYYGNVYFVEDKATFADYHLSCEALGHDFSGEGQETKAPGCATTGTMLYTCLRECGATKEVDIPATGEHTRELGEAVPADCENEGYTPNVCTVCGDVEKLDVQEVLGHSHTIKVGTDAEKQEHTYKCVRCEHTVTEACTIIEDTDRDKEASYTEEGLDANVCKICGQTYDVVIPKLECAHAETTIENKVDAECGKEGYSGDEKCTECGTIVTPGQKLEALEHVPGEREGAVEGDCTTDKHTGTVKCTLCGDELEADVVTPAPGHKAGDREGVVAGDCTTDAHTGYIKCTECGETLEKDEVIPAPGHKWEGAMGDDATCSTDAWEEFCCTVCQETKKETEEGSATGIHIYDVLVEVVAPTETESGYTIYKCIYNGEEYGCTATEKRDYTAPTSGKIANVKAEKAADYGIKVTWTAVEGAEHYLVKVYDAEGKAVAGATMGANDTSASFKALQCETYTVKVIAKIGAGYIDWAKADAVEVKVGEEAPVAVIGEVTESTIDVSWAAVAGAKQYYVKVVGDKTLTLRVADASTALKVTGLTPGVEYKISVTAELPAYRWTEYGQEAVATTSGATTSLKTENTDTGIKITYTSTQAAKNIWVYKVDQAGNSKLIKAITNTAAETEVSFELSYIDYSEASYKFVATASINIGGKIHYIDSNVVTAEGKNPVKLNAAIDGDKVVLDWTAQDGEKYWVKQVSNGTTTQLGVTTEKTFTAKYVEGAEYYIIAKIGNEYITSARVSAL